LHVELYRAYMFLFTTRVRIEGMIFESPWGHKSMTNFHYSICLLKIPLKISGGFIFSDVIISTLGT
jgi:hypothetical protein